MSKKINSLKVAKAIERKKQRKLEKKQRQVANKSNRGIAVKVATPVSNDLKSFIANNQRKFDTENFQHNGVPKTGLVSESYDKKAPDFNEAIPLVEDVVRQHPNYKLRYHTNPSSVAIKPGLTAILVADVHFNPNLKKQETDLIVDLYNSNKLSLGDGLFESARRKPLYNEDLSTSLQKRQAADVIKKTLNDQGRKVEFYAAESPLARLIYGIVNTSLMLFAYGAEHPRFEKALGDIVGRINDQGLGSREKAIKLVNQTTTLIAKDLGLGAEQILQLDFACNAEGFGSQNFTLPFIKFPDIMESNFWNDFDELYCHSNGLQRDDVIAEQFTKFNTGIHIAPFGPQHLPTLVKRLEQKGIPVIVVSRTDHEPYIQNHLAMLDSANHHERIIKYEKEVERLHLESKSKLAEVYKSSCPKHSNP